MQSDLQIHRKKVIKPPKTLSKDIFVTIKRQFIWVTKSGINRHLSRGRLYKKKSPIAKWNYLQKCSFFYIGMGIRNIFFFLQNYTNTGFKTLIKIVSASTQWKWSWKPRHKKCIQIRECFLCQRHFKQGESSGRRSQLAGKEMRRSLRLMATYLRSNKKILRHPFDWQLYNILCKCII